MVSLPKISVIIPVYNVAAFLPSALESLLAQDFTDLQIIIVDDASTDHCPAILHDFCSRDLRVRCITLDQNQGYGHAVNVGLDAAIGEFIHIFEPDDELCPEFYSRMLGAAEVSKADVVSCLHSVVNHQGILQKHSRRKHDSKNCLLSVDQNPFLVHNRITIWSLLIQRALIVENDIRLHESPGASFQDIGFYYQVIRASRGIYQVNQPLYRYRQHLSQSIHSKSMGLMIFQQYQFLMSHVIDRLSGSERKRSLGMLHALLLPKFVRIGLQCQDDLKNEYISTLLQIVRNMDLSLIKPYLSVSRLGMSFYRTLSLASEESVDAFIQKRKKNRFWRLGFIIHSESTLYRCLVKKNRRHE
jgi:glycosyltransferase involved in cell wall biosynthesis